MRPKATKASASAPAVKNAIDINGRPVSWSFVGRVYNKCGKDWDVTMDCFWKARHCTGANGIERYIMSGLRGKGYSERWMLWPSRERENGQMESIRQWWDGLYARRKAPDTAAAASATDVVNDLVARLGVTW